MKEGRAWRQVKSNVGVGGPAKVRPPPDRIPTPPAIPSDAHNGKPSRTRPYPWPLPSKGGPTRWKRAGTQGSRGSTSHPSRQRGGARIAAAASPRPSLGADVVVIGVCGRLAVGQHRTSTQLG